jgi:hypothetical protein
MRLFLIIILSLHGAAVGQTFSCQYVAGGGLTWENSKWAAVAFKVGQPFFLKVLSGQIDLVSVQKVFSPNKEGSLNLANEEVRCFRPSDDEHYCMNIFGQSLVFGSTRGGGAVSHLFGSLGSNHTRQRRDDIGVFPFVCEKF